MAFASVCDRVSLFIRTQGEEQAAFVQSDEFAELVHRVLSESCAEVRRACDAATGRACRPDALSVCGGVRQGDRDAVGELLKRLCQLAAALLALPGPLRSKPGAARLLGRLFLCDPACTSFLMQYGAVAHVRGATAAALSVASVPACASSVGCNTRRRAPKPLQ
jgi:hypothetical protein